MNPRQTSTIRGRSIKEATGEARMTAEIALLNKLAVTLAADSAVTITSPLGPKVYNSADKIFEATTHDPIGIMVFNNPEVSGIPVEVIVKMYRDHHCTGHYGTVFAFADAFLEHVQGLEAPEIVIGDTIRGLVYRRILDVRQMLRAVTEEFFRNAAEENYPSVDALIEAVDTQINELLNAEIGRLAELPVQAWAEGLTVEHVLDAHADVMRQFVESLFHEEPLPEPRRERVLTLLAWALLKETQPEVLTGIVFAGFGEDEKFPSLVAFEVYGLVAGRLKHLRTTEFDVDRQKEPDAAVFPFAQKEMVERFMFGIDGDFLELSHGYFSGALGSLKVQLAGLLAGDVETQAAITPAIDAVLGEFNQVIIPEHLQRSRSAFSDMVRSMPKQEMAALAESLVHITSLKRKFSAGAESVGGPIDVAMITRAEGFVWVRRKHYFDAALNPRYFHRHYGVAEAVQNPAQPLGELPQQ